MSKSNRREILLLAESASVDLLEEKKSLHDILTVCRSIAKTLNVSDNDSWIDLELNGYLVKYKTQDQLCDSLPYYRKTSWKFYDLYGNAVTLAPDIMDLFGRSVVYHSVKDLENSKQIVIGNQFLEKFNRFISNHGMDYASKNVRIHEARISKSEIDTILDGVKKRTQGFLDTVISILEFE